MSYYFYYMCLDHDPPLESNDEVTQHSEDAAYMDAVRYARARPLDSSLTPVDGYHQPMAYRWLLSHPRCRVCLVSEYDERVDIGQGIIGVNET